MNGKKKGKRERNNGRKEERKEERMKEGLELVKDYTSSEGTKPVLGLEEHIVEYLQKTDNTRTIDLVLIVASTIGLEISTCTER